MDFVRNAWYVAAWSADIGHAIFHRTLLGEPVVLFRRGEGSVSALHGICPHRHAPLGMGQRFGDNVRCSYHGLEFDGAGRCVVNPQSGGRIVEALHLRAYPVVEQHELVWIWMGDPALANPATIPDYSHLVDGRRRHLTGTAHVRCHYRLAIDNLMDLGHFQFLHGGMAQLDAGFDNVQREVRQEGNTVYNQLLFPGCKPMILFRAGLADPTITVDQFNDIRWDPVGSMRNRVGVTPTGQPRDAGIDHYGTHIVTPETDSTCHYFYGSSRNFAQDDAEEDALFRQWQKKALTEEDKPMLEAIQTWAPYVARAGIGSVMLSSDQAAVRVQRVIEHLHAAESPPP